MANSGITARKRKIVLERDNYTCQKCGFYYGNPDFPNYNNYPLFHDIHIDKDGKFRQLEIDHIIPRAKGGKHNLENLRVLCNRCNASKGSKLE